MSIFRIRRVPQVAVLTLAIGFAQISFGQPQGPDPEVNLSTDANPTQGQKDAALNAMVGWIESNLGPTLGMENPRQEWRAKMVDKETNQLWHFTLDQMYKGIPVKGGHLNFSLQEGFGSPATWHGQYVDDINLDTNPKIGKQKAIQMVEKLVKDMVARGRSQRTDLQGSDRPAPGLLVREGATVSDASLEIHPGNVSEVQPGQVRGQPKLTYKVKVKDHSGDEPIQMEAWVDNDGNIVEAFNNIQTTHCENGRGNTLYQGGQGLGLGFNYFKAANAGSVYVLNDNCARFGVFDMYGSTTASYQASTPLSGGAFFGNGALSNRNSTNADAYLASIQTSSFIQYVLGRNFVDGFGGPRAFASVDGLGNLVSARNHYGVNYNNAFWDGQKINLGDGNGVNFRSLTTLDIIGHEWAHGLTQFTGGLVYSGESGALNESFSDIFGAMTERYWYGQSGPTGDTWKIGEGAYTPGIAGDAMRYMYLPSLDGSSRNHYSQRYVGTADNRSEEHTSELQSQSN